MLISVKSKCNSPLKAALSFMLLVVLLGSASSAFADLAIPSATQSALSVPFIQDFGCSVIKYLKGPLAVMVFAGVLIATMVVGLISKMDWGRVVALCVLFGMITAAGGFLANNSYMQGVTGFSSCMNGTS